ncbi:glycosyltransferase [Candidatus Parcubacteria bacterium]|nr:MAG: glycosyltransferase [Candidatus Parcubacteria bacterium]
MRCPTLKDLPPPPPGKTGWPWTEESAQLPDLMPESSSWPRISIITPSLNQGQFIEETIRSVLLQGYPDIEYIIMDGGSSDDSISVIRKYSYWLSYWESKPDRGQAHAINRGFKHASGQINSYLNSDDFYMPAALEAVSFSFNRNHINDLFVGNCVVFNEKQIREIWIPQLPINRNTVLIRSVFAQPACFWTNQIHDSLGGLNESFSYCLDQEFFIRILLNNKLPVHVNKTLASFRMHEGSKTLSSKLSFYSETISIIKMYSYVIGLTKKQHNALIRKCTAGWIRTRVWERWRQKNRAHAIALLIQMIVEFPYVTLDRSTLGQAKRLFCKTYDSVKKEHLI